MSKRDFKDRKRDLCSICDDLRECVYWSDVIDGKSVEIFVCEPCTHNLVEGFAVTREHADIGPGATHFGTPEECGCWRRKQGGGQ